MPLSISRKIGQRVYLGDHIWIEVVDVDRGRVRLVIEAPREVKILREELIGKARTKKEQENAGQ